MPAFQELEGFDDVYDDDEDWLDLPPHLAVVSMSCTVSTLIFNWRIH